MVALCAEAGRGVEPTPRDVEDPAAEREEFCCKWAKGKSGSGAFFVLRSLKKGTDDCDFLGVVVGLGCDMRSFELASDLDDSDGRLLNVVKDVPFDAGVNCTDGRGDAGSSNVASDGLPLSSVNDFLSVPEGRGLLPSRATSLDRRNLAARFMREDIFFGPVMSLVGAVVMMAGGRGTGGGFSACCFALRESCESEAFRNRKTEKRLCLLGSGRGLGGVSGRLAVDSDPWLVVWDSEMPASSNTG